MVERSTLNDRALSLVCRYEAGSDLLAFRAADRTYRRNRPTAATTQSGTANP